MKLECVTVTETPSSSQDDPFFESSQPGDFKASSPAAGASDYVKTEDDEILTCPPDPSPISGSPTHIPPRYAMNDH